MSKSHLATSDFINTSNIPPVRRSAFSNTQNCQHSIDSYSIHPPGRGVLHVIRSQNPLTDEHHRARRRVICDTIADFHVQVAITVRSFESDQRVCSYRWSFSAA
ncbi:Hypothetical protein NTJ_01404 [Nesidiocoris tenuis]|uniref:Uncharacterized protein n=1 Tax=Nesidiocoris tenuis TaxID=355587 RepID=A0ABN7AEA2_9HEMI|nr:Hypothetical protein NTJ_01404 [Nesidiocoris tenuis]